MLKAAKWLAALAAFLFCVPAFATINVSVNLFGAAGSGTWQVQFTMTSGCDAGVNVPAPAANYALKYAFPMQDGSGNTYTIQNLKTFAAQNPLCPGSLRSFVNDKGNLPANFDPTTAVLISPPTAQNGVVIPSYLLTNPGAFSCLTANSGSGCACVAHVDTCTGFYKPTAPAYVEFWNSDSGSLFNSLPNTSNDTVQAPVFSPAPPTSFEPPPPPTYFQMPAGNSFFTYLNYFFATWQCAGKSPSLANVNGYQILLLCPKNAFQSGKTGTLTQTAVPSWYLQDIASIPVHRIAFSFVDNSTYPQSFNDFSATDCPTRGVGIGSLIMQTGIGSTGCVWMDNQAFIDYSNFTLSTYSTFVGINNIDYFPGWGCSPPNPAGTFRGQIFMVPGANTTNAIRSSVTPGVLPGWFYGAKASSPTNSTKCAAAATSDYQIRFMFLKDTNIQLTFQDSDNKIDPKTLLIDAGNGNGPEWPVIAIIDNYYGPSVRTQDANCNPSSCNVVVERQVYIQYLGHIAFQEFSPNGYNNPACSQGFNPFWNIDLPPYNPQGGVQNPNTLAIAPWSFCPFTEAPQINIEPIATALASGYTLPGSGTVAEIENSVYPIAAPPLP